MITIPIPEPAPRSPPITPAGGDPCDNDILVSSSPVLVVYEAFDSAPLPGDVVGLGEIVEVLEGGTLEHIVACVTTDVALQILEIQCSSCELLCPVTLLIGQE